MVGPAVRIRINGAMQMRQVGAELRAMGVEGKVFRRELLAGIRAAAAPAPAAAKAHARQILPKAGGLNDLIANDRVSVRSRLTGKGVGVRITNPKGGTALDEGQLRHPVYRNRTNWVLQRVRPGWFSEPMEQTSPAVTGAVLAVILRARRSLDRSR